MKAKIVQIFVVLFVLAASIFYCHSKEKEYQNSVNPFKDIEINLSEFKGRLFPHEKVHPGTFTIEADFEDALKWGKGAIMTLGSMRDSSDKMIRVWLPDEHSRGVFQYAETRIKIKDSKHWYQKLDKNEFKNGKIIIKSYKSHLNVIFKIILLSAINLVMIAFVTLSFLKKNSKT